MDLFQQGHALYTQGKYQESDACFSAYLEDHPDDARAWHMRGYIALQTKAVDKAIDLLKHSIELKPQVYTTHVNLGSALAITKQFHAAAEILKKAIQLHPAGAEAHYALGNCLRALNEEEGAAAEYAEAIRLKPEWPEALQSAAFNAEKIGNRTLALDYVLRALDQDPQRVTCHNFAGHLYSRSRQYDLALKHYLAALQIDPRDAATNNNLGLLYSRLGRHEDSAAAYAKAVAENPDDPVSCHGYSLTLLMLGRLSEGWRYYSARMERDGYLLSKRPMRSPRLLDKPVGKRALAWADEGIGEQIMFASMIPEVSADCTSLSVECDSRLAPLFQRSFPNVEIIPRQDPPHPKFNADYDGQFCLGNGAQWYRPDFNSFPQHEGYLIADADIARELRRDYQTKSHAKPLIGISWRTSDRTKISPEKTLGLENWGPILKVPGATFVDLQYGDCRAEIAEAKRALGVDIISDPRIDPLANLDLFAAQVAAMDLVVTISNATAHMAGALNIPVWTMVPSGFGAMWHWFLDREDSPWYPSMCLLRQNSPNEWTPTVDRASAKLVDFVAHWRPEIRK